MAVFIAGRYFYGTYPTEFFYLNLRYFSDPVLTMLTIPWIRFLRSDSFYHFLLGSTPFILQIFLADSDAVRYFFIRGVIIGVFDPDWMD